MNEPLEARQKIKVAIDEAKCFEMANLCRQLNHTNPELLLRINTYTDIDTLSEIHQTFSDDIIRLTNLRNSDMLEVSDLYPYLKPVGASHLTLDYLEQFIQRLVSICNFLEIKTTPESLDALTDEGSASRTSEFNTSLDDELADPNETNPDLETIDVDINPENFKKAGAFKGEIGAKALKTLFKPVALESMGINPEDFENYRISSDNVYFQYPDSTSEFNTNFADILTSETAEWGKDELRVVVLFYEANEAVMAFVEGELIHVNGETVHRNDSKDFIPFIKMMSELRVMKVLKMERRKY